MTNVSRNRVYSLTHLENQTEIAGIAAAPSGTATVSVFNNQVSIVPSAPMSQLIFGIYEQGGAGTNVNFVYNSVLVGGTASGGQPTRACMRRGEDAGTSTWLDNVCFNNRTGGGASHYAGVLANRVAVLTAADSVTHNGLAYLDGRCPQRAR